MRLTDMAISLFGPGGQAAVLIYLMLLAVVGWLLAYLAEAAQQGSIAGMIRVSSVFISIILVASVAWKAIQAVAGIAGFK